MTPEQQRETDLRLYRLAWRFPEKALDPNWSVFGDFLHSRTAFTAYTPSMLSVSATCRNTGVCTVTVGADGAELHLCGSAEYVETMLRLIPAELRPHVEALR